MVLLIDLDVRNPAGARHLLNEPVKTPHAVGHARLQADHSLGQTLIDEGVCSATEVLKIGQWLGGYRLRDMRNERGISRRYPRLRIPT